MAWVKNAFGGPVLLVLLILLLLIAKFIYSLVPNLIKNLNYIYSHFELDMCISRYVYILTYIYILGIYILGCSIHNDIHEENVLPYPHYFCEEGKGLRGVVLSLSRDQGL